MMFRSREPCVDTDWDVMVRYPKWLLTDGREGLLKEGWKEVTIWRGDKINRRYCSREMVPRQMQAKNFTSEGAFHRLTLAKDIHKQTRQH